MDEQENPRTCRDIEKLSRDPVTEEEIRRHIESAEQEYLRIGRRIMELAEKGMYSTGIINAVIESLEKNETDAKNCRDSWISQLAALERLQSPGPMQPDSTNQEP